MVRTWIAKAVGISGRALPNYFRLLAPSLIWRLSFDERDRYHHHIWGVLELLSAFDVNRQ
jgi:hypothetical protein